jgi:hypothetical protein
MPVDSHHNCAYYNGTRRPNGREKQSFRSIIFKIHNLRRRAQVFL